MGNETLCVILVLAIFALLICMLCRALAKEKVETPGMKFKDFVAWCNDRACDGCWGMNTAIMCIQVVKRVKSESIWDRESCWEQIRDETGIVEKVIIPINKKIQEMRCNNGR